VLGPIPVGLVEGLITIAVEASKGLIGTGKLGAGDLLVAITVVGLAGGLIGEAGLADGFLEPTFTGAESAALEDVGRKAPAAMVSSMKRRMMTILMGVRREF